MPKRTSHHKHQNQNTLSKFLRRPLVQVGILALLALVVFLIAALGNQSNTLPAEISVDQAYQKYQQGAFFLDVRTVEEWNEYHAPNTTLIPLDQLPNRLNELPRDREIVVVCRSGNRSQQGRDILLSAGFRQVTSMSGGLKEWRAKGYPIEP
jgi:rhodanese-related sulfurtransferase